MSTKANLISKLNSWLEFEEALRPLGKKEKGDAFEELIRLHLLSDPVFITKLANIWHHSEVPQKVIDELDLQQPEIGVDFVAQTRDGSYWAIQCKYHQDPTKNVRYSELRSFFSITERQQTYDRLSHRIVCTSTNGVSDRVSDAHPNKLGFLTSADLSKLGREQFNAFRSLIKGNRPKIVAYSPRPHQERAIENAQKHFIDEGKNRGKLIHPCGTGKSHTGYWIAAALNASRVLIAVPSLFLVRQTLAVWTREAVASGRDLEWLVVCSDEDVSKSDDPAMQSVDLGIDVTTNTEVISDFLKKLSTSIKVVISTYQSGEVTSHGARIANAKFDVGIFDEAHKTVGYPDDLFALFLSEDNISIDKRIFMTATERQYRGNSDDILSMDDPRVYGEIFDQLSFKAALEIDPPIMSDHRIVTIGIIKSEIEKLIASRAIVRTEGKGWSLEGDAQTFAALIALRKSIVNQGIRHTISFHRTVPRAKQFSYLNIEATKADPSLGDLSCFHVSGKDRTGKRVAEIMRFAGASPSLISNARCLTEGVDVPAVDGVLFADPRQSKIDIVQAAGRAMRKFEEKKLGYIVVPVIIDEASHDPTDSAFEQIITVVSALATQDERIVDEFAAMAANNWRYGSKMVDFYLPEIVRMKFNDLLQNIQIRIWDRLGRGWPRGFQRLQAFVDREGHARVPQRYTDETGFKLGSWVGRRRGEYKNGDLSLTPERIKALEELPGWEWDPQEADFQNGLERLRVFVDREGHARVPVGYTDETGFELGTWIHNQRAKYKDDLSLERIKALEEVPGWDWNPFETDFQKGLERLRAFVDREGHSRVPRRYTDETGFKLGSWVNNQRTKYKDLSPERIKALEEVPGWEWDPREADFQYGLERLQAFVDREGHARVPDGYTDETGFKLGSWVGRLRGEYKKTDLSPEHILSPKRIKALEELPGWEWDPREADFQHGLERLRAFVDREGHARVSRGYTDETDFKLANWVRGRRQEYKKGDLSPEHIKALEEVPGWEWDLNEADFQHGLERLRVFVERESHARVPQRYTDETGFKLGSWVNNQRTTYKNQRTKHKKGNLSTDRIKALEEVPGWEWVDPKARRGRTKRPDTD